MQVAESAKAVAEQCDVTVAMLADPHAAEVVATGPDGIAAGLSKGNDLTPLFDTSASDLWSAISSAFTVSFPIRFNS